MEQEGKRDKLSAFELKRNGDFEEALKAYIIEYKFAITKGNNFIADICFEQIFDCQFLNYLKEGRLFLNKDEMLNTIQSSILNITSDFNIPRDEFIHRFNTNKQKFYRKGFSVDMNLLIKKKEKKRKNNMNF
nr:hypothetical protein [Candidatus Freyarchaeota archaeon]